MKKLFFLGMFFLMTKTGNSQNVIIDSVKVFCMPFFSESVYRIDRSNIFMYADSIIIKNDTICKKLYINLKHLVKKESLKDLQNLRKDFRPNSINIRALFIFFQQSNAIVIGVSPQPMIFIDNLLYSRNDKKFETAVLPSKDLYDIFFPSKE